MYKDNEQESICIFQSYYICKFSFGNTIQDDLNPFGEK